MSSPSRVVWWQHVPLLVLCGSLALTCIGTGMAEHELSRRDMTAFKHDEDEVEAGFANVMNTTVALLRGVSGIAAASGNLDRDRFAAFATSLDIRHQYPELLWLGWAPLVAAQDREDFVVRMRRDDPNFHLWPESAESMSCPAAMLQPFDVKDAGAIGYDMFTEPVRRAAMEQATSSSSAVLTAPVQLMRDAVPGEMAVALFLPCFRNATTPPRLRQRRLNTLGFAYAVMRTHDLAQAVLDRVNVPVAVDVYDGTAAADLASMFRSEPTPRATYTDQATILVGGRPWTLVFRSLNQLTASRSMVVAIGIAGVLASFILYLTTLRLGRARDQAVAAARQLEASEAALLRSESRVRFIAEASGILGSSLDYAGTLRDLVTAAVPTFADLAAIDLVRRDGSVERCAAAHSDPAMLALVEEIRRRYPPAAHEPPASVIAGRTPLLQIEISPEQLRAMARDATHAGLLERLSPRSMIVAPLLAGERSLGALTFILTGSGRRYHQDDLPVVEDLAHRTALAIEHAQLFNETDALRREAEVAKDELRSQADELARSNDELEQFAYIASHDLQEPLRMITSFLELLQRRYGDRFEGKPAEFMAFVHDGARRMQSLIRDLLLYSRAGRVDGKPDHVSVDSVLDEVVANLRGAIDESHAVLERGEMPTITFARLQLTQLFQNLVGNAIKFHGAAPPCVRITANRQAHGWEFIVADNGIGIEPTHAERVFELFQRLHSRDEYAGTGIGLAICRKIVERNEGRIWTEPAPGGGAVFHFTVPDAAESNGASARIDTSLSTN